MNEKSMTMFAPREVRPRHRSMASPKAIPIGTAISTAKPESFRLWRSAVRKESSCQTELRPTGAPASPGSAAGWSPSSLSPSSRDQLPRSGGAAQVEDHRDHQQGDHHQHERGAGVHPLRLEGGA